jgi:prepilin-type N-terminal cleavage/methylation domain-containing protein
MKQLSSQQHAGFALLELLLALAVLTLILQIFPDAGRLALWSLDVRNWPRTIWFVGNVGVLLLLIALRFGPQLRDDWRTRRSRLTSEIAEKHRKQELKEQRDTLERLKQAQRRRIY